MEPSGNFLSARFDSTLNVLKPASVSLRYSGRHFGNGVHILFTHASARIANDAENLRDALFGFVNVRVLVLPVQCKWMTAWSTPQSCPRAQCGGECSLTAGLQTCGDSPFKTISPSLTRITSCMTKFLSIYKLTLTRAKAFGGPLSRRPQTRPISSAVFSAERLTRSDVSTRSFGSCIALRTWLGFALAARGTA